METIDKLKISEAIIAASYWQNFNFEKEMFQCLGANNPKVKRINDCVRQIQTEWHEIQRKIKELESEKDI